MLRRRCWILIISLLAAINLYGQAYSDSPYGSRSSYGMFVGVGGNIHLAGFTDIPQVEDCCPEWTTSNGLNLNVGAFYTLPITEKLELMLAAQFNSLGGTFEEEEKKTQPLLVNDEIVSNEGTFQHRHESTLNAFGGNLGVAYRLTNQLRLTGNFRASTYLSPSSYIEENIVDNSTALYENGTQKRILLEDEPIEGMSSLDLAVQLGASYDLPLTNSFEWFIVPMVNYSLGLMPVVEDLPWTIHTVSGGVGIRFSPRELVPPAKPIAPPPPPPPPPLPTPPPPPITPTLDATIVAVSVDEDGNESDISLIKVEENYQIRTHPLLNYVFFEDGSSNIPSRYASITEKEKISFSFREFLDVKTMDVYYNILNIVGKRMQFYPQSTIKLVGTNSGEGKEAGNKALSQSRAQSVKNYLTQEWDIDATRITLIANNLPDNPSNKKAKDGIQENRRVEMFSNISQIFEPMIIRDTVRTSNPPYMRFKPTINAQLGVKEWRIITSQDGIDIKTFSGAGQPPAAIDWFAAQEDEQEFIPKLEEPLDYRMEVIDNDGKQWISKNQTLPVDQITIQKKIFEGIEDKIFNKFSMIGFPYNSSEIVDRNKSMLVAVKRAIEEDSEIFVSGYSDRLGDDDYNLKLAQRRADAVGKALNVNKKNINAFGESRLLYDNEFPEGRFYSRTVLIDVITTIE